MLPYFEYTQIGVEVILLFFRESRYILSEPWKILSCVDATFSLLEWANLTMCRYSAF